MCAICTRCTTKKGDLTMGNEPVNSKTFGGVSFNWNQVKSAKVKTGENGQKIYFIEFKTGVTAEYPMQEDGSMQSRELTMWQSMDYDTETVLKNLKGAKIKGSEKDDHIIAKEVTDSTIDVSGDNNDDHVDVESEYRNYKYKDGTKFHDSKLSKNNTLILGKDDTATKTTKIIKKTEDGKGGFKVDEEVRSRDIEGPGIEN